MINNPKIFYDKIFVIISIFNILFQITIYGIRRSNLSLFNLEKYLQ